MPRARTAAVLALLLLPMATQPAAGAPKVDAEPPSLNGAKPNESEVLNSFGRIPLSFERNVGQSDPSVRFLARTSGYTLFLSDEGPVFSISGTGPEPEAEGPRTPGSAVAMELIGANPSPKITGRERLPGAVSYFKGSDPDEWRSGIPTWGQVRYEDVYPGIDLLFRGSREQMEYDFIIYPGADPERVSFWFPGVESLRIRQDGDLAVKTPAGSLVHQAPKIYQMVGDERRDVAGGYTLKKELVRFSLGEYDPTLPLVIDPLVWSTFLGGSGSDHGRGVAVDGTGRTYVTGQTFSTDFPTAGVFDPSQNGSNDAFVARFNPAGTALEYATFLGGSSSDQGLAIAVDGTGRAYVAGLAFDSTPDFPTTPGAFDEIHNGNFDAFVARLNSDGTDLEYSTFLGGSSSDHVFGVAVDGTGRAYVTGVTTNHTTAFPTTGGAFDSTHNGSTDAFVTRLNSDGTDLEYSTFLGGGGSDSGFGVAVDGTGRAYIAGLAGSPTAFPTTGGAFDTTHNGFNDAFLARLNPAGSDLEYSTFLGGSGLDIGWAVAVDGTGRAYVTGQTGDSTTDLPTTFGAFDETPNGGDDAFVARLNPAGSDLEYSTFLGGSSVDIGLGLAVDSTGRAYVAGETFDSTTDFPTTTGAFDEMNNGNFDAFAARLNPNGTALDYSTFLGGGGTDIGFGVAVDGTGRAYVAGQAGSHATAFPTTVGGFDTSPNGGDDAFVASVQTPPISLPGGGGGGVLPPPPPPPPGPPQPAPGTTELTIEKEKVPGTHRFEISGEVSPSAGRSSRAARLCEVGGQTVELWRSRGRSAPGELVGTDMTDASGRYQFGVHRAKGRRFFRATFSGDESCKSASSQHRRIRGKRFGPNNIRTD